MNWMVIISGTIASIATIIIALATWKYTTYSKKTLDEFKKQREFLTSSSEEKYKLERRPICIRILREINDNEIYLNDVLSSFTINSKDYNEIIKFISKSKYHNKFKNSMYNKFLESNLGFKNNKIVEDIDELYWRIDFIKNNLNFLYRRSSPRESGDFKVLVPMSINLCKESLNIINNSYDLFNNEIGYDYRKSESYKTSKNIIKFFKSRMLPKEI